MTTKAIIYTRVSTDDQADHGFSLPHQKEVLTRYCDLKNIHVAKHFQEDHSAKNFDRPQWSKLMSYVKANRKEIDLVLFTRWDRFSRNIAEAYQVINLLLAMGVSVNSIEQPLDLSMPDNKIMLAIYLAVPEVENDKISIRVKEGTRKAKQLGCWTNSAPIGFKNHRDIEGRSTLLASEKAGVIRETFDMILNSELSLEAIRIKMRPKGLTVSRSRFYDLIKNVVYIGKIKVNANKDFEEEIVEGLHDGIVSERLFYSVQDKLSGKKRKQKKYSVKNERFPLRGYIQCSSCGNQLTASSSKGRGGYYHYYHCKGGCKERIRAEDAHELFDALLEQITISKEVSELYYEILKEQYKEDKGSRQIKITKLQKQVSEIEATIETAEDNLFIGKIEQSVFNKVKDRYQQKISDIRYEIEELKGVGANFMKHIKKSLDLFKNLKKLYHTSNLEGKQLLVGSILGKKIIFSKNDCRTASMNVVLNHILHTISNLKDIKKGQIQDNLNLSSVVGVAGFEPATSCSQRSRSIM